MKAVHYERFGERPTVADLPDPTPAPGGVVVKVTATGVCRSDWHGWMGHDPDITLPHVPGHELAGEVVAVGRDVRNWHGGERVTVPFVAGCGRCGVCRGGDPQVCPDQFQPGFTAWGSFAEYVALGYADANLVALPDDLDDVVAAGMGCRFSTAFRAVTRHGRPTPGQWVAVFGCGGVGLGAVMIAHAAGARVLAVDVSDKALSLAGDCGAEVCVDANAGDVPTAVRDHTGGGAHVTIDALGSTATAVAAIESLRRRARHVQVGLLAGTHHRPRLPMERIIGWELQILGSHGMAAHDFPAMLDLVAAGRLRPDRLIDRTITLAESIDVLTTMDQFPTTGMAVVRLP